MEAFGFFQIVGLVILAILVIIFFYYVPFMLWINAVVSGVHVSLIQLFLMRIRKVPPTRIVNCLIEAHKAGLTDVKRDGLEAHFLAGGHIERVVHALVSASKANMALTFQLDTVLCHCGHRRSINHARINRHLHCLKHIATCKVNGSADVC